jgi:hypothetical protein
MRAAAWHTARVRFDQCWQRTTTLIVENRGKIERLAGVLLTVKGQLTGDEILEALEGSGSELSAA